MRRDIVVIGELILVERVGCKTLRRVDLRKMDDSKNSLRRCKSWSVAPRVSGYVSEWILNLSLERIR